jgi:cytochrome c oxidase subunit 2
MIGSVIVMERSEYQEWLAEKADNSLALEGRKLFTRLQCITCHTGTPEARAPDLGGIYLSKVTLNDGRKVQADDNYLRRSVLQPAADVVAGYRPIMPVYTLKRDADDKEGQLTQDEFNQLLAYLKSLKRGDIPMRVEDTPAPAIPEAPPNGKKKP